jgi:hypothetical protein
MKITTCLLSCLLFVCLPSIRAQQPTVKDVAQASRTSFWSRNSYPQIYPQRTVPRVPFSDLAAPVENVSR